MRISDWSSDVCSSDLCCLRIEADHDICGEQVGRQAERSPEDSPRGDLAPLAQVTVPLKTVTLPEGPRASRRTFDRQDIHIVVHCPLQRRRKQRVAERSEEHTSELQSLMSISNAVF